MSDSVPLTPAGRSHERSTDIAKRTIAQTQDNYNLDAMTPAERRALISRKLAQFEYMLRKHREAALGISEATFGTN